MNGMTTDEINKYFTKNNTHLLNVAKGICYKFSRKYNPAEAITEVYLFVITKQFKDVEHLEKVVLQQVKTEITGCNSFLNYKRKVNDTKELFEVAQEEDVLNPVIEYMNETSNVEHRIVLEAYIEQGYNTQPKLAEYFKLSTTTINKLFKEIKQNILIQNQKNHD